MAEGNCTHYWIIDADNVGVCQYCGEVRDFGKLLEKAGVFVAAGRRGAKARKEVLGKKKRKSIAAKERWQDPEYRARQSDAMKKLWQDPEYRAKHRAAHAPLPGQPNKKEELL